MGFLHAFGTLLLFCAMGLLIIVSVSTPIWKDVYFLKATLAQATGTVPAGTLKVGMWGYCVGSTCSSKTFGYNIDFITAANASHAKILHNLTYALILNPIAGAATLLALFFAWSPHFVMGVLASLLSFLAFIITIAALGVDLGLVLTARSRINKLGAGNHATVGNATWFVVAAAGAQLIAAVTVCCTHAASRRNREAVHDRDFDDRPIMRGSSVRTQRTNQRDTFDDGTATSRSYAGGPEPIHDPLHRNSQF